MTDPTTVTAELLHRYVDGQLGPAETEAVESYLALHPDAAAEVSGWKDQNEAVRALFPPVSVTVDRRFDTRGMAREIRHERRRSFTSVAAAIVLLLLGSGVGWFGRDYLQQSEATSDYLIDAAVQAHALYVREKTHAVEVAANAPNLMTWLSNRITTPIDAPDLSSEGYRFLGGRLLPGDPGEHDTGPAAQLMYENGTAQRVTLYITAALPDKREVWNYEERGGLDAYYWANDKVTCTIVGGGPEAELKALGTKVFEQLTWRPDEAGTPT